MDETFKKLNYGPCRKERCPFYLFDGVNHCCTRIYDGIPHIHHLQEFELEDPYHCLQQNRKNYINWDKLGSGVRWNEAGQHYELLWPGEGFWSTGFLTEDGHLYSESAGS